MNMRIEKSLGCTDTEKVLSNLCDRTFLNIWSYANPFNQNRKELCDVIAIFENHIFIFFDRSKALDITSESDFFVKWNRWYKTVIEEQIKTCYGAERYIKTGGKLYLDGQLNKELPVKYELNKINIHKIIVAHGAKDACLEFSEDNISGSLGICYMPSEIICDPEIPFFVSLEKEKPIHIFDSQNLEIILTELDTFRDFTDYIVQKEKAIKENTMITYCGEEDLLAYYLMNFDEVSKNHFISQKDFSGLFIVEGEWDKFVKSPAYHARKKENQISYFWDELINDFGANALKGALLGNGDVFSDKSGIYEMAKEPRFFRRALSKIMLDAISNFPNIDESGSRLLKVFPSYNDGVTYVFLQQKIDFREMQSEKEGFRRYFLEVACGAIKLSDHRLKKIIGIGMFPPKYDPTTTKDILFMDCSDWNKETEEYYKAENEKEGNRFLLSSNVTYGKINIKEFPDSRLKDS